MIGKKGIWMLKTRFCFRKYLKGISLDQILRRQGLCSSSYTLFAIRFLLRCWGHLQKYLWGRCKLWQNWEWGRGYSLTNCIVIIFVNLPNFAPPPIFFMDFYNGSPTSLFGAKGGDFSSWCAAWTNEPDVKGQVPIVTLYAVMLKCVII